MSERRVKGDCKLNRIWWALMNSERTQNTNRSQSEKWMYFERYVNARWSIYSECLGSYPYIIMCFVSKLENLTNKLHLCISISLNIISDWTVSKCWTNGEHIVNKRWALCEQSVPESASEHMVNDWKHCEHTEKWESRMFQLGPYLNY